MPDAHSLHTTDISKGNISRIAVLEQCCFQTPWSPSACAAELTFNQGGGFAVTHDDDKTVAGYVFYRVMIDEMHILKIATAPHWRKRHIASTLLQKTVNLARAKKLRRICLETRASNLPAINLYRKFDFEFSGRRPRYYNNQEDAVLMTKNIWEDFLS